MTLPTDLHRISVVEYGLPESVAEHAQRIGLTADTLERHLTHVSQRISDALNVNEPVVISRGMFRVVDVAGLIRLAPNIEMEVRPKFLGATVTSWREDFFAVATIARYGHVFSQESLRSTEAEKGDLADLLGRAVVTMYDRNYRRPLRTYRQAVWRDFNIDAEVDPESLLLPESDGFIQSGIVLDKQNQYNAVMHEAMSRLLTEIRDGDTRRQVYQRHVRLSPQKPVSHLPTRRQLPSRHLRWQELYDLSRQILEGFGIGYSELKRAALPGYIIKTDDAWETLLFAAARAGLPDRKVEKKNFQLGTRSRLGVSDKAIRATPDITIQKQDGSYFAADAKYKCRVQQNGREASSIEPADLYEALAFLQATSTNRIALVYPLPTAINTQALGATAEFERATVGENEVVGITINVNGISQSGGFRHFSESLCATLVGLGA